jgi:Uma2 family endonuclease
LRFQAPRGFRSELINGEIVLSPDPKTPHYDLCERLYKALEQVCPEPKYKVLQRINLRLKSTYQMPSPDVMVIDYGSWIDAQISGYPATTPFLVAEVISPSNRKKAVAKKVQAYLEEGIPEVWVVYPKRFSAEVHRKSGSTVHGESDSLVLPEPLPQVGLSIRRLLSFGQKILN